MKKLFMLLGILASLAMVSAAWADTLSIGGSSFAVTPITVFDNHGIIGEYGEVEPTANTSPSVAYWDFRGMYYANQTLYVVAGFDTTVDGNAPAGYPLGDLFIKTGAPYPNLLPDGHDATSNTHRNDTFVSGGYTYAVTPAGQIKALAPDSALYDAINSLAVGSANPYKYAGSDYSSGTTSVTFGRLSTIVNSSSGEDDSGTTHNLTGDFYAAYNLAFLGGDLAGSFYHLSYACGNDGVNALLTSGSGNVPIPPSVLLLGSGLVGLAYARRRRLLG